jgi:hypothetical protein
MPSSANNEGVDMDKTAPLQSREKRVCVTLEHLKDTNSPVVTGMNINNKVRRVLSAFAKTAQSSQAIESGIFRKLAVPVEFASSPAEGFEKYRANAPNFDIVVIDTELIKPLVRSTCEANKDCHSRPSSSSTGSKLLL